MTVTSFAERHVLVIGERLAPVAQEALGQARFEVAGADRLELLNQLTTPMDLVLVDAESTDAAALVAAITALAGKPNPPAVLLAGDHMPMSLVRALMKLPRSDVL